MLYPLFDKAEGEILAHTYSLWAAKDLCMYIDVQLFNYVWLAHYYLLLLLLLDYYLYKSIARQGIKNRRLCKYLLHLRVSRFYDAH